MSDKIITIARFENYEEADFAKQMLEDEGIKCAVVGQNAANVFVGLPAVGRIELQVFEGDAQKAIEILNAKPEGEQQEQND
jgi:hypothetical protein